MNLSPDFLFSDTEEDSLQQEASELSMYTKERAVQDENPLKWWKQNVSKYPTLSVLARQYLSIPGTNGRLTE
jgi:hypothetical protein